MANNVQQLNAEIRSLIKALNNQSARWKSIGDNIVTNFGSTSPAINAFNGVTQSAANLISPLNNITEAFKKSDDVQKKMLAVNTDLKTFTKANSASLDNLRGGFLENAEELFENFSEGIRFNSKEMMTLQNRMKLTGQSTDKLRQGTKFLLNATEGNVESVGRLSQVNMDTSRKYMISNEKLIDALARNEETIDYASLFGLGEEQSAQLMKLTGLMESKGISVKNQQQVLKLMYSTDASMAQMRATLGASVDLPEKLLESNADFSSELNKIAGFAKDTFIQQKGNGKMLNTNNILQGIGGEEMRKTVTALMQTNSILASTKNNAEQMRSPEDKFYNTFDTYAKESKNFYERTMSKHYNIMETVPGILKALQMAQVGGMAGGFISDLFSKKIGGRLENISKAQNLLAKAAPGAARASAQAALKIATGGILKTVGFTVLRFLGPIGMIVSALEFLPIIIDGLKWLVGSKKSESDSLNNSTQALMASVSDLSKITVSSEQANKARTALVDTTKSQIDKINRLGDAIKRRSGEDAFNEFASSADAQQKAMKSLVEKANQSNLQADELRELEKKMKSDAEEFFAKIDSNTKFTAANTKQILDRTPIPESRPVQDKEMSTDFLILDAIAVAMGRKTTGTKEQAAMLEKLDKVNTNLVGIYRERRRKNALEGDV
jgi:hypothetical protein